MGGVSKLLLAIPMGGANKHFFSHKSKIEIQCGLRTNLNHNVQPTNTKIIILVALGQKNLNQKSYSHMFLVQLHRLKKSEKHELRIDPAAAVGLYYVL